MKYTWDESKQHIQGDFDLFMCFASFEERCLSFIQNCPTGIFKSALILFCSEFEDYSSDNLSLIKEQFKIKNIESESILLHHNDPIISVDNIINALERILHKNRNENVLIDITTFTHEMLLVIIRIFHDLYPQTNVSFVYSNAGDYDPQTEENDVSPTIKWLSKGIVEIRSIIGFPGNHQPTNRTHLVIVVGYEYDRAMSIISEIEPYSLSLAFGKPDSLTTEYEKDSKHYGAKEHFNELTEAALAYFPEDRFYTFDVSCNDPIKTKCAIEHHLQSIGINGDESNIIIFALNNKPSTVGVGLFGLENSDVQLCYAPALLYNYSNYSTQGNNCYFYADILGNRTAMLDNQTDVN